MLSDYETNIIDNVAEYGCSITSVGADDDEPNFSYSIGFWESVGAPEVIVFGLPFELQHSMINSLLEMLRAGEVQLADGAFVEGLLQGFPCAIRRVHEDHLRPEYLNSAIWYHRFRTGRELTEAMQVVWPDAESGKFPWQSGCGDRVRAHQPELYLPGGAA